MRAHPPLQHDELEEHERLEPEPVHEFPQRGACPPKESSLSTPLRARSSPQQSRRTHVHLPVLLRCAGFLLERRTVERSSLFLAHPRPLERVPRDWPLSRRVPSVGIDRSSQCGGRGRSGLGPFCRGGRVEDPFPRQLDRLALALILPLPLGAQLIPGGGRCSCSGGSGFEAVEEVDEDRLVVKVALGKEGAGDDAELVSEGAKYGLGMTILGQ